MKYFTLSFTVILFLVLPFSNLLAQTGQPFKGHAQMQAKVSFSEIEEYDQLFPVNMGKGRQIENEIEHFPTYPIDPGKIVYQAKPGDFLPENPPKDDSPLPDIDFEGLGDSGGSIPPDVNGAAGPDYLMVTLNTEIRIMDKTGAVISTVGTSAFWHPFPGSGGVFDPKITYDPYENHWILVMPSSSDPAQTRVMVAVSENSDPTGNWFMYSFDGDPTDTFWFDYPDYGFNSKWLVITGNLIQGLPDHSVLYVINKNDLYNYSPNVGFTRFEIFDGFSLIPAMTFDPDEPDVYIVDNAGGNDNGYGYAHLRKITGNIDSPEIQEIGFMGVPYPWNDWSYFNNGDFAPQLGSDEKFNTVDARIENMVFRNGKLWFVHHVYLPADDPVRSSVQWWEVTPDGTIQQWGRLDDTTGFNFCAFASIAVNAKEDVMIGYGSFSTDQYASSSYTFRYADDPPNTLRQPYLYKAGLAAYYKTYGGTRNRWGDYTSTCIDPVNDLDFWTLQEYAEMPGSQDEWGTWWAKVNIDAIPKANFTSNIQQVPVGSGVDFTDMTQYEPESWQWFFEGGTPASSTEQNPQDIQYNTAGQFDVTLIATNYLGSDTLVMENYIDANTTILPQIDFTVNDTIPCLGDTVQLSDLSIYNPNAWQWVFYPGYVNFVNGTNANSQNPEVVFEGPFLYNVTLTATNNNGSSVLTKTAYIKSGGQPLPFTEDFETWSFDHSGWTIDNPDGGKTWDIKAVSGNEPGGLAAMVNIKNYNGLGERDRLISPPLNLYAFGNIQLIFEFAYAQRYAQYTDSLLVYISSDCGTSWVRIYSLGEDGTGTFATHLPSTSDFYPALPEDWCGAEGNPDCVSIDLSDWAGESNISIMFETYNGFGNNIFIDNISINGDVNAVSEVTSPAGWLVYPNPVHGKIHILKPNSAEATDVSVCDLIGKVLTTKHFDTETNPVIPAENLSKGVYIIKIASGTQTFIRKVVVQ